MEGNQPSNNDNLTDKELYKIALETRNFEINLFWKRSNYFLVLNSALAIGFFNNFHGKNSSNATSNPFYPICFAIFGFIVSILWLRVNLGSKFWQARWENVLIDLEKKRLSKYPSIKLFSAESDILNKDAEEGLKSLDKDCIGRLLKRCILQKPSVSRSMIYLSIFFCIAWAILFCLSNDIDSDFLSQFLKNKNYKFCLDKCYLCWEHIQELLNDFIWTI